VTRRTLAAAILLALPALASAQMGPVPPPPMAATPGVLQEVGFDQKLGDTIPLDLAFKDETGKDVKLGDYFGKKPVVLSLVYYQCPMLCTISLNGLAGALEVLSFVPGQEFEVLTVSFDPKEGPILASAKKKTYMTRYKRPEAGWHFLTGSKESVDRLTKAVGFRYVWDATYLFGVEYSPKDLRLALVDAAGGKIGNAVDQALLYCYQYNPKTGRYSASILNVVRLGGLLTVAALGGFILIPTRRRRGRAQ